MSILKSKEFIKNFFVALYRSIFRVGYPRTERMRSESMVSSFLLHIHPAKIHKHSLKFTYTFGLGLISFFLFIILTVTGIVLMFYYIPSVNEAYNSIKDIENVVAFGQLLRNLHRWAAHAMVFIVFLHMCRVFYTASYKTPREFNWIIGVGLFLLTLFLSFSGYLLPWDQLAYWAVTVGTNISGYVPILGQKIKFLLLGEPGSIGQSALLRFYVLHCVLLPLIMAFFIAIHFWRIRKDGGLSRPENLQISEGTINAVEKTLYSSKTYELMALVKGETVKKDIEPDDEIFTWPNLLFRELILFVIVLTVLMLVSIFFNAPLEEPANPAHPTNPAKAPWYFLGLQELVSYSAFIGGVLVPAVIVTGLLILPYIDRKPVGIGIWFAKERKIAIIIFSVFAILAIAFTLIGTYFRGENWLFVMPWVH